MKALPIKICGIQASGQDGSIGRHTEPPAQPKEGQQQFKNKKQPELTETQTVWESNNQANKEETFIRPVGGAETGSRAERTRSKAVADPVRWWIVEWGRPGCS